MSVTIQTAVDTFLLDAQGRGLRPQSILTYRRQLGFFQAYANDLADLDQVTTAVLRGYIVHLQVKGLRPASIRTAGRILRAWLNFCKADGLITDAAPMQHVRMPRSDRPHPDCFTVDEVRRLLAATDRTRYPARNRAILLCLLDTGARVNEFTVLLRSDIDMDTGAVTLRGETTKTHARRVVFIGMTARAALAAYLAASPSSPYGPLWVGEQGPLTTDSMKKLIQRMGKSAGVHPAGPHKYRRTFATWAQRDGMNATDTAALLGHSVDMLLKLYVHSDDDALRAAHAAHGPVDKLLLK